MRCVEALPQPRSCCWPLDLLVLRCAVHLHAQVREQVPHVSGGAWVGMLGVVLCMLLVRLAAAAASSSSNLGKGSTPLTCQAPSPMLTNSKTSHCL